MLSRCCSGENTCAEALQQRSGCSAAANAGSWQCSTFQHVLLQAPAIERLTCLWTRQSE